MAFDFLEIMLNIGTGGLYSLTKETAGAISGAIGGAGAPGQPSGGTPTGGQMAPVRAGEGSGRGSGQAGEYAQNQPQKCCCWEISGDYLLNSETGQVWLISKDKMELLPIRKNLLPLEKAATGVTLLAMKQVILEQKDMEIAKMPNSLREPMSGHINTVIKALDQEIAKK